MASNEGGGGGGGGDPPRGVLGRNAGKGRLPTIRPPRDLTLGGSNKKTYAPTIPVRPKDRPKEESNESSSRGGGRGGRDRRSGRGGRDRGGRGGGDRGGRGGRGGRGRGGGPELVQTQSIFEQGAANHTKPRGMGYEPVERGFSTGRGGGGGEGGGAGAAYRPLGGGGQGIKREIRDDAENKEIIEQLLRDDFIDEQGLTGEDPAMNPMHVPLMNYKAETKTEAKIKVKEEPDEVKEVGESGDARSISTPPPPPPPLTTDAHTAYQPPVTAGDIFTNNFKSEHGELLLFQLPDTLPSEPPEAPPAAASAPSTSSSDPQAELAKRLGLCSLKDYNEGKIGKLQVTRSGKVKLVLGKITLDVNMGVPAGFLQEVVSARVDGAAGDFSMLGHIYHKLICTPDIEGMLDKQSS